MYVPSPRNDAVRTRMAPSGKSAPKARPMVVPCATTACRRSGLTWESISIAGLAKSGEYFGIEEAIQVAERWRRSLVLL